MFGKARPAPRARVDPDFQWRGKDTWRNICSLGNPACVWCICRFHRGSQLTARRLPGLDARQRHPHTNIETNQAAEHQPPTRALQDKLEASLCFPHVLSDGPSVRPRSAACGRQMTARAPSLVTRAAPPT